MRSAACNSSNERNYGIACNDGIYCTDNDTCNSGVCAGTPGLPPAAIDDSVRVDKTPTNATIAWVDPPGFYEVYRGSKAAFSAWSYNQVCWSTGVIENSATDRDTPLPGQLFYYLVSRVNTCSESSLGTNGAGVVRPNNSACVPPADADHDGVPNIIDNCPATPNTDQLDGDDVLNAADNRVSIYNPDQADSNNNGIGDACEPSRFRRK